MYLLLGVCFLVIGIVMLKYPKIFFDITEGWKNREPAEPSKWFLWSTRVGGVMLCLVGIMAFVVIFFSIVP